MKKALSLLLALVLCLSLCACEKSNSNHIVLTKDNIETYFNIRAGVSEIYGLAEDYEVYASLEGVSDNFNYENISVTFKIRRNARCFKSTPDSSLPPAQWTQWDHEIPYEAELTVTTNIAGEGQTAYKFMEKEITCSEHNQSAEFQRNTLSSWEIIAVSGYLVSVG